MNKEELLRIHSNSNSQEVVSLEKNKNEYYICKKWKNVERGMKSIKKQINFDDIKASELVIRSPKVYSTLTNDNGYFEANMEYIHGHTGSEIAFNGNRNMSIGLRDALSLIMSINIEHSRAEEIPNTLFISKIDEILNKQKTNDEILEMIKNLREKIIKQSFFRIPIGPCHGDLTLSNIIITETGSVNLIDFLPTFIETPLWDIVKLYQDLHYGWSYRKEIGALKISAKIFFENCMPNLMKFFEDTWKDEIKIFDSLNLARLSPYVKDKETEDWLTISLKNSLNQLN
tara:strand:- start:3591 stop:4451 length:861 start_codon:yes stop_codon:yes gene_type:complete